MKCKNLLCANNKATLEDQCEGICELNNNPQYDNSEHEEFIGYGEPLINIDKNGKCSEMIMPPTEPVPSDTPYYEAFSDLPMITIPEKSYEETR